MRAIERIRNSVRIHARDDDEPRFPSVRDHLAVEIALLHVEGAALYLESGGIVGDDAAGISAQAPTRPGSARGSRTM